MVPFGAKKLVRETSLILFPEQLADQCLRIGSRIQCAQDSAPINDPAGRKRVDAK
jgi:hypothetical protein